MADLAKVDETRGWIASWLACGSRERAARVITAAAIEQRANLERCERDGRFPGGMRPDEYRASVKLLERAARKVAKEAL